MAKKVDARLEKRQETFSLEVLVPVYFVYCVLYLNRRRIKKKSILLFSSRHAIAMRMPMQGSCHFVVCTTFSLALPCHEPYYEPYYLHLPDTRSFGGFLHLFAFCPSGSRRVPEPRITFA